MNSDMRLVLNDATFITDVLSENIFLRNGVLGSDQICDAIIHSNISDYKLYAVLVVNKRHEYKYNWIDIPQLEAKYVNYAESSIIVSYFDGRSEPLEDINDEKIKAISNTLANSANGVIKYNSISFNEGYKQLDFFSMNTPDPVYFISPYLADKLRHQKCTGFSIK